MERTDNRKLEVMGSVGMAGEMFAIFVHLGRESLAAAGRVGAAVVDFAPTLPLAALVVAGEIPGAVFGGARAFFRRSNGTRLHRPQTLPPGDFRPVWPEPPAQRWSGGPGGAESPDGHNLEGESFFNEEPLSE